jgi:hypothetical protein
MYRGATWVGFFIAIGQQLTGINLFLYYGSDLLKKSITTMTAPQAVFVIFAVNMVGAILGVILLNFYGRKPILIFGSAVQTAALLGLGISMWV